MQHQNSTEYSLLHRERLDKDNLEDFVDILLAHLEEAEPENKLTMEQVLFELEDFLGGHSAVSNLIGRAIVEIASVPALSTKIFEQVRMQMHTNFLIKLKS